MATSSGLQTSPSAPASMARRPRRSTCSPAVAAHTDSYEGRSGQAGQHGDRQDHRSIRTRAVRQPDALPGSSPNHRTHGRSASWAAAAAPPGRRRPRCSECRAASGPGRSAHPGSCRKPSAPFARKNSRPSFSRPACGATASAHDRAWLASAVSSATISRLPDGIRPRAAWRHRRGATRAFSVLDLASSMTHRPFGPCAPAAAATVPDTHTTSAPSRKATAMATRMASERCTSRL